VQALAALQYSSTPGLIAEEDKLLGIFIIAQAGGLLK